MASSLVLKQLFASTLVTRSLCCPTVTTASRFLSTKSTRANENPLKGYPLLGAQLDLFYKFIKCDSDDKTSQGLEKGDRKAYLAMSLKGIGKKKAKDVMETKTCDLLKDIKGLEFEFKSRDLSLQMKNGVLNLSLPEVKNEELFNKLEIKFSPSIRQSSWSFPNGGTYYTASGKVSIIKYVECESGDETTEGLEEGDKKVYMTLSLKGREHKEETEDVKITKTYDLSKKIKGIESDHECKDGKWSLSMKNGVLNVSCPEWKEEGKPNKWEIKFV